MKISPTDYFNHCFKRGLIPTEAGYKRILNSIRKENKKADATTPAKIKPITK